MKLNRHNYEEYFILYLDNELGSEDRREVELFAGENPDLKAELDILLQSKLIPDTDITFTNKESLFVRDSSFINMNNYEEWLLSYIDNELTTQEIKDTEQFIAAHPSVKKELELFQKTKLRPDIIAFPGKESLYRKEEKAKVVAIRWWRIAAAAVLLIAISTTAIILLNKNNETGVDVAGVQKKQGISTDDIPVKQQKENTVTATQENVADNNSQKIEPTIQQPGNLVASKKDDNIVKEKKAQPFNITAQEAAIVKNDIEKKPGNNLPRPENNPNVITGTINPDNSNDIAVNTNADRTLTNSDKKTDATTVTSEPSDTYNLSEKATGNPTENPDAVFASENNGKKNKLRGFFRKITRTFEKRTNMKATDDEDRLLIAGLAIKLN